MNEELFYMMFIFIILGSPFCGANNCETRFPYYYCENITSFPDRIIDLEIYCNKCSIEKFTSEVFPSYTPIKRFYMTNSILKSIDAEAFYKLNKLLDLHLENNVIDKISPRAFAGLQDLNELHLEHNNLTTLPSGFLEQMSSISINLSYNKISQLESDVFKGTDSLFVLNLSNNQLNQIHPSTFNNLNVLQVLNLSYNKLSCLAIGVFKNLNKLMELDLSNNVIQKLHPGSFSGLWNLEWINLVNNSLASFNSPILLSMPKLVQLDISGNGISDKNLHLRLLENAPQLKTISIEDNFFTCRNLIFALQLFKLKNIDLTYTVYRPEYQNIQGIACVSYTDGLTSLQDFLQLAQAEGATWNSQC